MTRKTLIAHPPVFRFKAAGETRPSLFLAGSIEMGTADDWQTGLTDRLNPHYALIYNPRRPSFDPNWPQHIAAEQFNLQVTWELEMIERADVVAFVFDPKTKSPITLLELGIASQLKPHATHVLCPEGFWRKGNVDIVCERYNIRTYIDMPHLATGLMTAKLKAQQ